PAARRPALLGERPDVALRVEVGVDVDGPRGRAPGPGRASHGRLPGRVSGLERAELTMAPGRQWADAERPGQRQRLAGAGGRGPEVRRVAAGGDLALQVPDPRLVPALPLRPRATGGSAA